jgi:FKBP-type peptidyl-prolyl cis-trans isomerase
MFYTGYLVAGGHIFDDSVNDGGTPFQFVVGAGRTITGFDEGASGMQAGETRIVFIPAAEGYGTFGSPPAIPANADLIFVLTLVSFS